MRMPVAYVPCKSMLEHHFATVRHRQTDTHAARHTHTHTHTHTVPVRTLLFVIHHSYQFYYEAYERRAFIFCQSIVTYVTLSCQS